MSKEIRNSIFNLSEGSSLGSPSWTPQKVLNTFGSHVIGLWPLDDLSGTTARDISIYGNNATYNHTGLTLNQPGIYGKSCAKLEGCGISVNIAGFLTRFNPNEGFISLDFASLLSSGLQTNNAGLIYIQADSSNRIFLRCSADVWSFSHIAGGVNRSILISMLSGERFTNIGIRWSKSEGKISFYINGVEYLSSSVVLGDWVGSIGLSGEIFPGFYSLGVNRYACNHYVLDYAPSNADILKCYNSRGSVCFVGDSRTNQKYWLTFAAEDITALGQFSFNRYGIINAGVSGATTTFIASQTEATNAKKVVGKNNIMVLWAGVNDGLTGQATYDKLKAYCIAAKTSGWNKVILCTEIDCQEATHITNGWAAEYLELNTLIRNDHSFVDAVADLGASVELQDATDLTYFLADKTHLKTAGYLVVASVVNPILKQYMI